MTKDHPRPHRNCYWVQPGRLLAGEYPGAYESTAAREKLCGYLDAGITFFLDLTDPRDGLESYVEMLRDEAAARGITVEHRRISIRDMSVPDADDMAHILDMLDEALADGHNVYVHCWGGLGGRGGVVGCHLVRHGMTGEAALAQIAHWWRGVAKSWLYPRSPQTEEQAKYVRDWKTQSDDHTA
ncbi:MAG: protein-tyrosine phosphatase family protein [Anaerolineales bacterium]